VSPMFNLSSLQIRCFCGCFCSVHFILYARFLQLNGNIVSRFVLFFSPLIVVFFFFLSAQ
jgi:hypothetical protein